MKQYIKKQKMKTTTQNTATQNSFSGVRLVVLFVLLVVTSFSMVGQNKNEVSTSITLAVVASDDTVATAQSDVTTTNTTMNFVSWFMGTKQTPNSNKSADAASSEKKQMINSGIAPNRLLIKAFLKKASNYSSTIA